MKARIEEIMSRILSEKHDAKVTIKFKERDDEHTRENNRRVTRVSHNARTRNNQS